MTFNGDLYPSARMNTLYNGCEADLQDLCAVRIDQQQIRVEYSFDGESTVYVGQAIAPGHYRLEREGGGGQASLHRFPDSTILEGSWFEEGERGMWRIELQEPVSG